ncbi:hypothetical protein ATJ88_2396 [Isoptericola jiangsuensis]|uniref:Uncharacterized protein n=1 Tax=Isoptericola jiangsuensis TaxID=548579 RepID=A0A2A9EZJ7_9MICO|nr:hypothetical protein [Isoptericola jiangsuensis]PFG43690.1 hypothetical protein ATJ88_2396 [Isoptericola jiangsuensis]
MSRTRDGARADDVRPLRVVRAVLLAAVTVACSAAAHTAAGGGLPDAAGIVLLAGVTLVVTSLLARWRLRPSTLAPVLAGLQVVLHHGLQLLAPSRVVAPSAAAQLARGGRHADHRAEALAEVVAAVQPDVAAHAGAHLHPAMLAAHAAAVVVITTLAVGADRALARTVGRFRAVVTTLLTGLPPVREPARPVVAAGHVVLPVPRRSPVLRARRGPPVLLRTA